MNIIPRRRARRAVMQARLNRLLPRGINRWYPTPHMARLAAERMAHRFGDNVTVKHHRFRRIGLPHYHLQFLDGRRLRCRCFYGPVPAVRVVTSDDYGYDFAGDYEDYDSVYDRERQKFLRGLINNPDQPRFVRGWAQQEINRLQAIKRAKAGGQKGPQGQVGPGGDRKRLRTVPGLDVGHIDDIRLRPRQHDAAGFRLENTAINKGRPSRVKRFRKIRAGKKVRPSRGKRLPLP